MSITLGTPTNSGNLAGVTGATLSHTTNASVKTLVSIITGYDSSALDSVINSVTFGGVEMTQARYYRSASGFIGIYFLENPTPSVTKNVVVTMAGSNTDLQLTNIDLLSNSGANKIKYQTHAENTVTGVYPTITVSTTLSGTVAIGAIVAIVSAITSIPVVTGTLITGSPADMGNQCISCASNTGSGNITLAWGTATSITAYLLCCLFYEEYFPTITLDSPADGVTDQSITPELKFTGSDTNSNDLQYEVQIDTNQNFNSLETRTVRTLGFAKNNPSCLVSDGTYLYAGLDMAPAQALRLYLSDFSTVEYRAFDTGEDNAVDVAMDSTHLYFVCNGNPIKIVRILLSDFSTKATHACASTDGGAGKICMDDTTIYITTSFVQTKIIKILKSEFGVTDTSIQILGSGISPSHYTYPCQDATYVYVAADNGRISRVSKATFTLTSYVVCIEACVYCNEITQDTDNLYAIFVTSTNSFVYRVSKSTFKVTGVLALNSTTAEALTIDSTYLYVSEYTTPAKMLCIELSTFSLVSTGSNFATDENSCIDNHVNNSVVYGALRTTPGKLIKIENIAKQFAHKRSNVDFGFLDNPDIGDENPFTSGTQVGYQVALIQRDFSSQPINTVITDFTALLTAFGQSFTATGGYLLGANFHIRRTGSPTGSIRALLYAHSGTFGTSSVPTGSILATSGSIDASLIPTVLTNIHFRFDGDFELVSNTKYVIVIEHTGSATSNMIQVNVCTANPHSGNISRYSGGSWQANSGQDINFNIYESDSAAYLTNSTQYYWRVRALDPSGSNLFTPWSSARSFTTKIGYIFTWQTKSIKYHNGSTWVAKPLKSYIGGSWQTKIVKRNM